MVWHIMAVPEGWVVMRGPTGRIVVPPDEVWIHEQQGWWRADKIPEAQDAPGEAIPMDIDRGKPPESKGNAEF